MKIVHIEEALRLLGQAADLQTLTADYLSQARGLLDHEAARTGPATPPPAASGTASPYIDHGRLLVEWQGRRCPLGDTVLLRFLERLCLRPNHFVRREHLLQHVWHGDRKEPSTVRSAVRRLRRRLKRAGMRGLASAIRCEGGRYGLVLDPR
jgi:DNA-binding response OmpR family regulator